MRVEKLQCTYIWNPPSLANIQHSMSNAFLGAPGDRRPGAGDGWMPDVVRQLVGIGMVPGHVMNLTGLQLERCSHVLSSALAVL